MRLLYVVGLMLVTSLYTFSDGRSGSDDDSGYNRGKSNKKGGDDDSYKYGDDDDKYNSDDDDDGSSNGNGGSNQNYLEVSVNSMCSFTCSMPEHLEQDQIIRNAVSLKFKTKNSDCSIYAKIGTYNYPYGSSFSTLNFSLQHSSNNSSSVQSLVSAPIRLLQTDQRLFVQPKKSQTFHFHYDAILGPVGYEAPAGQYNFTVVFTMTQP